MSRTYHPLPSLSGSESWQYLIGITKDEERLPYIGPFHAEEIVNEFTASRFFGGLSEREKSLSRFAMKQCSESRPWRLQMVTDDNGLFPIDIPRLTVAAEFEDELLLSGAAGWRVYENMRPRIRDRCREYGIVGLRGMVMLGAAYSHVEALQYTSMSYDLTQGNETIRQTVGGDIHGDFLAHRIRWTVVGPVIDPTGNPQEFSPDYDLRFVKGYHSVEEELTASLLLHLSRGNEQILEEIKPGILQELDERNNGRAGGNFADFGLRRIIDPSVIYSRKELRTGGIIGTSVTAPRSRTNLVVVSCESGVKIANEEDGTIHPGLDIDDADIPRFIAVMAAASGGRTSFEQIRDCVMNARFYHSQHTANEIDDST